MFVPDVPRFVAQQLSILQLLDLVDPDQPVLGGERLLQVLELDVLVADLSVACSIKAGRRPEIQLWTQIRSLLASKRAAVLCLKCQVWKVRLCILEMLRLTRAEPASPERCTLRLPTAQRVLFKVSF